MSRFVLVLALSVPLVVLAASSRAHAWGTYNPGLSQFEPAGVYTNGVSSYGNNNNPYAGEFKGPPINTFSAPGYGFGNPYSYGGYGTFGGFGYGGLGYGGLGYGGDGPGLYRRW